MRRAIMLTMLSLVVTISQTGWTDNSISNITGMQLHNACSAAMRKTPTVASTDTIVKAATNSILCSSYIAATNDTIVFVSGLLASVPGSKNGGKMPYCIPDSATDEDKINTVLKFIDESPAAMSVTAPSAIYDAFVKYYPCK